MMGRGLALCGWLARQAARPFGGASRGAGRAAAVALAALLLVGAVVPLVVPLLDPQPERVGVDAIFDGAVTDPDGWVRLTGRVVPLSEPPTDGAGAFALLVDAERPLRAIVLRSAAGADGIEPAEQTTVTGHLAPASVLVTEELPIEATVAGTPPRVVSDRLVDLDPAPKPERAIWWPLAIAPALLGGMLLVGARVGYPVFRPTRDVDVLAAPLGTGERVPAAYGGRIGPNERDLADPGAALLLVRRGPRGSVLTAQPLAEDARLAPAPVTIGGGWTSGRLGEVSTVTETVPALEIRSELVHATFLFARTAERDRVAALVAVER